MHQLFLDEVDGSLISLHYTLADPAAGITDYPKTFGGISWEQSQEAMSRTAELLVKLEIWTAACCGGSAFTYPF